MQPTPQNQQNQNPPPQPPPEPNYGLRWLVLLGLPIVLMFFIWVQRGVEPSFAFRDIMDALDVGDERKFVRLSCLSVILVSVVLVVKTLKNHSH